MLRTFLEHFFGKILHFTPGKESKSTVMTHVLHNFQDPAELKYTWRAKAREVPFVPFDLVYKASLQPRKFMYFK